MGNGIQGKWKGTCKSTVVERSCSTWDMMRGMWCVRVCVCVRAQGKLEGVAGPHRVWWLIIPAMMSLKVLGSSVARPGLYFRKIPLTSVWNFVTCRKD